MSAPRYVPFEEAAQFVRGLAFNSVQEYWDWCSGRLEKNKIKPSWIPSNPHQVYKKQWTSFSDFLGTKRTANFNRVFLSFEEARDFARALGLDSLAEWKRYCAGEIWIEGFSPRPQIVPSNPNFTYKNLGWAGYRDWLGTGLPVEALPSRFRALDDARGFVRSLNLAGWLEWRKFVRGELKTIGKLPDDIPAVPHAAYKSSGWISYADWLGTHNSAYHRIEFREYGSACEFVHKLGLTNIADWRNYCAGRIANLCAKPADIPSNPDKVYPDFMWDEWFHISATHPRKPVTRET